MSNFDDLPFSSGVFTGKVRIFPLPNLVLFPSVMQPLHIFEPRYQALLEDALATDRMIAMALLKPGWENDYDGRPPLYPMACLGQVTTFHRLADNTYNLLVLGVKRVRLVGELDPARSYREGKGLLCEDLIRKSKIRKKEIYNRRCAMPSCGSCRGFLKYGNKSSSSWVPTFHWGAHRRNQLYARYRP